MKILLSFTIAFIVLIFIVLMIFLWIWIENWGGREHVLLLAVILGYAMNSCDKWVSKKHKQIKEYEKETKAKTN